MAGEKLQVEICAKTIEGFKTCEDFVASLPKMVAETIISFSLKAPDPIRGDGCDFLIMVKPHHLVGMPLFGDIQYIDYQGLHRDVRLVTIYNGKLIHCMIPRTYLGQQLFCKLPVETPMKSGE